MPQPGKTGSTPAQQADEARVEEWVRQAQGGDRQAFELLFAHFQDRVWRRALYRLGDHDEAYDVAQEVFLTCFRKIHQFRGEARFWSWLCRIVDNHVINHRGWQERRGRSKTFSLDQPPSADPDAVRGWDPPDPSADPRREAQDHEAMAALDRNLGELGADHREILLLRFADGLSYEEIAEHLQISLGTVKSRINRARAELRARMKDHLDSTEA